MRNIATIVVMAMPKAQRRVSVVSVKTVGSKVPTTSPVPNDRIVFSTDRVSFLKNL